MMDQQLFSTGSPLLHTETQKHTAQLQKLLITGSRSKKRMDMLWLVSIFQFTGPVEVETLSGVPSTDSTIHMVTHGKVSIVV